MKNCAREQMFSTPPRVVFFDPDVFAPAETPERANAASLVEANNETK
ncbi:MAG: hypothetical protein ABJO67_16250 [Pseudoruegeria sp.]